MRKLQNNALPSETAVELSLSSLDYYVALFSIDASSQSSHLRTHLKRIVEKSWTNTNNALPSETAVELSLSLLYYYVVLHYIVLLRCSFHKGRMAIGSTALESLRISIFLNNIWHLRRRHIWFFSRSSIFYLLSFEHWMGVIFWTLDWGYLACDKSARIGMGADS